MPKNDFFRKQVQETLFDLTKDTKNIISENIHSPYGYRIDFGLNCNENSITDNLKR